MEEVENKAIRGRDNKVELLFLQTLNVFLLLPAAFLCRDLRQKNAITLAYIYMHTNII